MLAMPNPFLGPREGACVQVLAGDAEALGWRKEIRRCGLCLSGRLTQPRGGGADELVTVLDRPLPRMRERTPRRLSALGAQTAEAPLASWHLTPLAGPRRAPSRTANPVPMQILGEVDGTRSKEHAMRRDNGSSRSSLCKQQETKGLAQPSHRGSKRNGAEARGCKEEDRGRRRPSRALGRGGRPSLTQQARAYPPVQPRPGEKAGLGHSAPARRPAGRQAQGPCPETGKSLGWGKMNRRREITRLGGS